MNVKRSFTMCIRWMSAREMLTKLIQHENWNQTRLYNLMIVFHRTSSFFLDDGVSIETRVYPQAHNFNTIIKWIMDEIVFIGFLCSCITVELLNAIITTNQTSVVNSIQYVFIVFSLCVCDVCVFHFILYITFLLFMFLNSSIITRV